MLGVDGKVQVPYGMFRDAMITRNYSGIEPNVEELKYYARGVGPVLELLVSGGSGRSELLSTRRADNDEGPLARALRSLQAQLG